MTGRRSLRTFAERESRAFQFQPGHVGGRVASAQPVSRRQAIGETRPASPLPLYWWKMDNATGGTPEAISGVVSMEWGTPTYQATALAPGSTYAITLGTGDGNGQAYFSTALAPGADGLIVFDWWMAGITLPASGTSLLVEIQDDTYFDDGYFWVNLNGDDDTVDFYVDSTVVAALSSWADPAHVRWETNPTAGTSVVKINGSIVGSATGLTVSWAIDEPWYIVLGKSSSDTTYDEFKVYGTQG